MSSSKSVRDLINFTDLDILKYDSQNTNVFDDFQLEVFKSENHLPPSTIFHDFDPDLKADHASKIWVCFPVYPFELGLTFPFPHLITNCFEVTKLCFPQLMPMGWRLLLSIMSINQNYGLEIGLSEIAYVYNLRTHGSSRFVFQRKSNRGPLVSKLSLTEPEWRNRFFFVKRSSIPEGDSLPVTWVRKAPKFDSLVTITDDSERRVKQLWEIEEGKRNFRAISTAPSNSYITEHSQTSSMAPKKKLFDFSDMQSKQSVKEEKPTSPIPQPRANLRSKNKRQKSDDVKNDDVIDPENLSEGLEKAHEALRIIAEERNSTHNDLMTVQAEKIAAIGKHGALKKEISTYKKEIIGLNKEILDLKAEHELRIQEAIKETREETIEDAKHSTLITVLQCQIQMAEQTEKEGVEIWKKSTEDWKKELLDLEEKEALDGLEMVAMSEDQEGTSIDAVADKGKEKVEEIRIEDPKVGDEGRDT